jgi:hypothetical protein
MPPVGLGWRHPHDAPLLAQRPALDFLEVHSENFFGHGGAALAVLCEGRAHYPISLHGVGLSLGSAVGLDEWHLDQLARLVADIDPIRVSDHASFARAPWQGQTLHAADLLPVPWTHEALAVMAANVQRVQDRLRRPIAVENLSAYVGWAHADWSEPDFLTELARRTGCQLLVDVNNLMVNAKNARRAHLALANSVHHTPPDRHADRGRAPLTGMHDATGATADGDAALVAECCAWLDALGRVTGSVPGDLQGAVPVAELHVAGHADLGDIAIDDHGSRVSDAVWQVHAHALRHWPGVPTLVEWDTDIPELDVLLAEVERARTPAVGHP